MVDDQGKNITSSAPPGTQETPPRDLSFLWPVIDRIRAVEIKFHGDAPAGAQPDAAGGSQPPATDVESRLKALETDVANIKQMLQDTIGELSRGVTEAVAEVSAVVAELPPLSWPRVLAAAVLSIGLLLLAHWLAVFVFDVRTLILRLISIAIPLPIAVWLTLRRQIRPWTEVAIALAIGVIAVFGMSYVTSVLEKTTFLPENLREWRETFEYVASITFAHLTGVLISSALQARSGAHNRAGQATLKLAKVLASVTGKTLAGSAQIKKQVDMIHDLINKLMPVASGVAAIIAGLKGVV